MPRVTAWAASAIGTLLAVAGVVIVPLAQHFGLLSGAEVLLSAMGTVFVLAGVTIALLGARMLGSRTFLALEREQLTVTVRAAWGPERRHVVPVGAIEHVGLDNDEHVDGATYSVHIRVRGQDAIVLDDARTSARSHHEHVAEEIRGFLCDVRTT
jgi:hypothetical protein